MNNTLKTLVKNQYLLLFILLVTALSTLFLYFKPHDSVTAIANSESDINSTQLENPTLTQNQSLKEVAHNQATRLSVNISKKTSDNDVLYDTKSDMAIQPVNPETDPANKIDKN